MMFATLDDLEGSVEMIVFGNAIEQYGGSLDVDEVVLVRGRVDHKDANKTCIVVQSVEPFKPTQEEVDKAEEELAKMNIGPQPFGIRINASLLPATFMQDLKELLETFPGESDVILDMVTRAGRRTLKLGPTFRVSPNVSLRAELEQILGAAALPAQAEPAPAAA
jgi:DNA polymerase-3 subunit alpha